LPSGFRKFPKKRTLRKFGNEKQIPNQIFFDEKSIIIHPKIKKKYGELLLEKFAFNENKYNIFERLKILKD